MTEQITPSYSFIELLNMPTQFPPLLTTYTFSLSEHISEMQQTVSQTRTPLTLNNVLTPL